MGSREWVVGSGESGVGSRESEVHETLCMAERIFESRAMSFARRGEYQPINVKESEY